MSNYKIVKQEGNRVEIYNTRSGRTFAGTLFANGTKVALENWGGKNLRNKPKIVSSL